MYRGQWIDGPSKAQPGVEVDEVVDTNGIVFRVTGEYEDGSLELEAVFEDDGYTVMERPLATADVCSDYDPAPMGFGNEEPMGSAVLGYAW